MMSPCKGCGDREIGCHSKCEKYKAFKEPFIKAQQDRLKLSEVTSINVTAARKTARKWRKR